MYLILEEPRTCWRPSRAQVFSPRPGCPNPEAAHIFWAAVLGRLKKLNLHRIERKDNTAAFRAIENAGVEQCGHIAMHGLDVTLDAPSGLPDRHGPSSAQSL